MENLLFESPCMLSREYSISSYYYNTCRALSRHKKMTEVGKDKTDSTSRISIRLVIASTEFALKGFARCKRARFHPSFLSALNNWVVGESAPRYSRKSKGETEARRTDHISGVLYFLCMWEIPKKMKQHLFDRLIFFYLLGNLFERWAKMITNFWRIKNIDIANQLTILWNFNFLFIFFLFYRSKKIVFFSGILHIHVRVCEKSNFCFVFQIFRSIFQQICPFSPENSFSSYSTGSNKIFLYGIMEFFIYICRYMVNRTCCFLFRFSS